MVKIPGRAGTVAQILLALTLVPALKTGIGAQKVPEYPLADFSLFKEPVLSSYTRQGIEAYRVCVIPTFASALCIRAERHDEKYSLVAKALGGKGGYEWGKIKKESKRAVSQSEWTGLLARISDASFWSLPETAPAGSGSNNINQKVCLDGTTWIVEGVDREKYRKVSRYCPSDSFESIGDYFLHLAGWTIGG